MKITLKCAVIYIILFIGIAAMASGSGGVIPTGYIIKQAFNFILTILVLGYFTKDLIKAHFTDKHEDFHSQLKKAKEDKEKAQTIHKELKNKISKLETHKEDTIKKAHAEAEELKDQIIFEARDLAKKIEQEADRTAVFEIEKAKEHLREDLIEAAFAAAESNIVTKIDVAEHKKLGSEFIDKIQVVR